MRALLIFVFSFFLFFNASSQDNYIPGFIISLKEDTTFGFIKNRSLSNNSEGCYFRKSMDSEEKLFLPFEIQSFRLEDGNFYYSKKVKINNQTENLFLQYLVDGKVDLYYLNHNNKESYFLQKNDSIYELKNTEILINDGGTSYIKGKREYWGILNVVLGDCKEIKGELSKSKLNNSSLVKIVNDYHKYTCKDDKCIIYQRDNSIKYSVAYLAGIDKTSISFTPLDDYFRFLDTTKFKSELSFNTGLQVTFAHIFGLDDNFDFNIMAAYRNEVFKSSALSIRLNKIFVPVYMNYYFNNRYKLKPRISVGFSNSFTISSDISDFYVKKYSSVYSIEAMFGLGLDYKLKNLIFTLNLFTFYEPLGITSSTAAHNFYLESQIFNYSLQLGIKKDL
jgi:hypothetical protein